MTTTAPPTERAPAATDPRFNRSRVTNGHLGVDGRSKDGRRWRDLYRTYREAMPAKAPSAAQDAQLRSLALTTLAIEQRAASAALGAPVDATELAALVNAQARLLDRLGLTPTAPVPEPKPGLVKALADLQAEEDRAWRARQRS